MYDSQIAPRIAMDAHVVPIVLSPSRSPYPYANILNAASVNMNMCVASRV